MRALEVWGEEEEGACFRVLLLMSTAWPMAASPPSQHTAKPSPTRIPLHVCAAPALSALLCGPRTLQGDKRARVGDQLKSKRATGAAYKRSLADIEQRVRVPMTHRRT